MDNLKHAGIIASIAERLLRVQQLLEDGEDLKASEEMTELALMYQKKTLMEICDFSKQMFNRGRVV